jgi:hypothetical protein
MPIAHPDPAVPDRPLSPEEALVRFFMDNADKSCNAETDTFVEELLKRMRAIQALANPPTSNEPRKDPGRPLVERSCSRAPRLPAAGRFQSGGCLVWSSCVRLLPDPR